MNKNLLIVPLSGQIQHTGDTWHTEEGSGPGDFIGPTYTTFRVAAAAYVAAKHPTAKVVATGYAFFEDGPTIASVVKEELIRAGVEENRIRMIESIRKTYQELQALQKLADHDAAELLIITNEWHLIRVEEMLRYFNIKHTRVLAAEAVLLEHDAAMWGSRIQRMRQDPRIAERIV